MIYSVCRHGPCGESGARRKTRSWEYVLCDGFRVLYFGVEISHRSGKAFSSTSYQSTFILSCESLSHWFICLLTPTKICWQIHISKYFATWFSRSAAPVAAWIQRRWLIRSPQRIVANKMGRKLVWGKSRHIDMNSRNLWQIDIDYKQLNSQTDMT